MYNYGIKDIKKCRQLNYIRARRDNPPRSHLVARCSQAGAFIIPKSNKGFKMQKTYYNKGEANAILSGIAGQRNRVIYGSTSISRSFPSNTTLERIQIFINTVLSAEDREAVRLNDADKKLFTWFAQNLDDASKRAEYQRALDMDVDINELERVIKGK